MNEARILLDTLPAIQRMALAYCTRHARPATLALLALDTRFASLIRHSREPMLAQMRLAWWRETLGSDMANWPLGDPLLWALRSWDGHMDALAGLAEGWEAMTMASPMSGVAIARLAHARGAAFAALSMLLGHDRASQLVEGRARAWALSDIAAHLGNPVEERTAIAMRDKADWRRGGLPRDMRPLAVLHGMAAKGHAPGAAGGFALLAAIRLGLLGR